MAKRANGEGTIYKRKDGKWCSAYYIINSEGKHRRKYLYGRTQKEVRNKLEELKKQKNVNEDSGMLLQEWMLIWLEKYKKNVLKKTTYDGYKINIETHIVGSKIGVTSLEKITTGDLQDYYNIKLDGVSGKKLSRRTVEYLRTIIGSALKQAFRNDLIRKNPNDATILPKKDNAEIEPLTIDEVKKVLWMAKGTDVYALIATAFYSGMRKGELLGLKWENVDFCEKKIFVKKNLCRVWREDERGNKKSELILLEPKSKNSIRNIPITSELFSILKEHKQRQNEFKIGHKDIYEDKNFVFTRANGRPLDPREVSRKFQNILVEAGIGKHRFHDIRHTFATILINQGEPIVLVSDILGHADINVTTSTYVHLSDATKLRGLSVLDGVIGENGGKSEEMKKNY